MSKVEKVISTLTRPVEGLLIIRVYMTQNIAVKKMSTHYLVDKRGKR